MFEQAIPVFFYDWLLAFFSPQKRVYWGYLCSALIISLFWLSVYKKKPIKTSFKAIFSAESWLSKSAQADYLLMIINSAFISFLSLRLQSISSIIIMLSLTWFHHLFDGHNAIEQNMSATVVAICYTLTLFILDDFVRYCLHRWLHTIPILWAFHKVHHSATSLNPITVFRVHPIEAILMILGKFFVSSICIIVFVFFFGDKVTLITILGASIFTFLFDIVGSNLRHSNIPLAYYHPIERIFISPAQHQIHHSLAPEHINKNYGVVFSLWDLWFGSHCYSSKDQALTYGLQNAKNTPHSFFSLYCLSFKEAWKMLIPQKTKIKP